MQKEKRNKITTLTSPLAGEDARRAGEGERGNTLLNLLIGFECVRTQNHFPRQGGSHTTNAFTLIELLVVVLIIGILAAVALPQYQKAVEKSKAAQAQTMLKTVYNAAKAYELANGSWPRSFDELAIDIPWTDGVPVTSATYLWGATLSNKDWSLVLKAMVTDPGVQITRIAGKYQDAGFVMLQNPLQSSNKTIPADTLLCVEGSTSNGYLHGFTSNNQTGDYCKKIMKGTEIISTSANRYFTL